MIKKINPALLFFKKKWYWIKQLIFAKLVFKIRKRKRVEWVEDMVVFEESSGKQIATPSSSVHIGSSFSEKKAFLFLFFIFFIFFVIIVRLVFLQIIQGGKYASLAEGNREKNIPIEAERGHIYDRNGVQLTQNIPNFYLAIMPHKLPQNKEELDNIIKRLSEITQKPEEHIKNILDEFGSYSYESIVIQEDLDYETALSIQIAASDMPGIHIQHGSKRLYVLGENKNLSLSHILGYQSKLNREDLDELYDKGYLPSDSIGKTGVEKTYESLLRGIYGNTRLEVNAYGKEQSVLSETAPVPGHHIKLSIDVDIQEKLEDILNKTLQREKKSSGSAVVLNPKNGEVLALVSLPSFDNNDFSGGIDYEIYQSYIEDKNKPLFNRSISGSYPSGSTIKPAIAAAALQEGIITSRTSFLSTGGISVDPWFFPDWQAGGHGNTDVRKSIAWSVNTFYYYIGGGYKQFAGLGIDKITDYLGLFGFGEKLGIDLPAENSGFLPSPEWKMEAKNERWYIGDTYNVSIGQGDVLVTPLQIAVMTAAVANNGTIYKPHVVRDIIDPITEATERQEPEIMRENIINPTHLQTVRLGMRDCVVYGSCIRLSFLPINVAGKTGTAQWSSLKEPHAWFTSFAPYENPRMVLTVLVEEGSGGSAVAVPVADEFYRWAYNNAKL